MSVQTIPQILLLQLLMKIPLLMILLVLMLINGVLNLASMILLLVPGFLQQMVTISLPLLPLPPHQILLLLLILLPTNTLLVQGLEQTIPNRQEVILILTFFKLSVTRFLIRLTILILLRIAQQLVSQRQMLIVILLHLNSLQILLFPLEPTGSLLVGAMVQFLTHPMIILLVPVLQLLFTNQEKTIPSPTSLPLPLP